MPRGQIVPVNFRGGIEEKVDPRQAPPGTILSLVNCRQQKTGRLERRYGSVTLTDELLGCAALMRRQGELVAIDNDGDRGGQQLLSWSPAQAHFMARDFVSAVGARRDPVKSFSDRWMDPTVGYGSGLEVWVWRTMLGAHADGDVYALIRDAKTGAVIRDEKISTGTNGKVSPKLVVMGTTCYVVYGDIVAGDIKTQKLDLTNPLAGWGAPATLRNDADVSLFYVYFDCFAVDANNLILVYWTNTANALKAYRYDATLAQQATANIADDINGYTSIAITVANNVLFVAIGKNAANGKLRFATLNATTLATTHALADLTTPVSVEAMRSIGIVARDSSQVLIVGTWPTSDINKTAAWFVDSAGASSLVGNVPWLFQISKPFVNGIDFYQLVSKANQNTHYLVNWKTPETALPWPFRVSAVLGPRIANNSSASGTHATNHLADVPTPSAGARITTTSVIADASTFGSVNLQRARFDFADRWLAGGDDVSVSRFGWCELGLSTHIAGGLAESYDGICVAETSFLERIDSNQVTLTPAGAGGSLSQGTYLYVFYWEVADAQGQIHRSVPSTPLAVVTPNPGTVNKVTIGVPNLTFTNFARPLNTLPKPYLVVCRTLVNGLATAMYRVTLPDAVPTTNYIDPITATARLTIVDTLADVTLATQALCYTATGALENACPSSFRHVCVHRGRVFGIGDDGKTVWASTQAVSGEAIRYNEILQMQSEEELIALGSLDDKLVFFGEEAIWVVYGDGPNDLGVQSDWTTPMPISKDVGCIAAQSVVRTNDGIFFQSRRGMYMLGRNLELVPFKSPEDTIGAFPCVTASVNLIDTDMVMWSCINVPGSSSGRRLVFDTFHKVWATDLFSFNGTPDQAVSALVTFNGVLHTGEPAGSVFYESKTWWLDGSDFYKSTFEIMGPNPPMGFQRVRKAQMYGQRFTNHDFKLSLAIDDGAYLQSFQWTAQRLLAMGSDNLELRVGAQNGMNPRCSVMKVKGEILTPTTPGTYPVTTGQSASFSGIGFDIVPKPSMPRLGAANART